MKTKLNTLLIDSNSIVFVLIISFFGVLLNYLISYISHDLLQNYSQLIENPIDKISQDIKFVLVVVVGPFFETAIFQYLLIVFILKYLIKNPTNKHFIGLVIFSAFLFALTHNFSTYYILFSFIFGIYFGYLTIMSEFLRKKKVNVFISVGLTHSIINLITFLTI